MSCLFALLACLCAQDPVDAEGDPLPRGAVMRIGTLRLRHDDTVTSIAFAPDGKTLVSCGHDGTLRPARIRAVMVRDALQRGWDRVAARPARKGRRAARSDTAAIAAPARLQ